MQDEFEATLEKVHEKGGWTYFPFPAGSGDYFGTRGYIKLTIEIDGHKVVGSAMAMGNGVQMYPVNAALRKTLGKDEGDKVRVKVVALHKR